MTVTVVASSPPIQCGVGCDCGPRQTWRDAVRVLERDLQRRYGASVTVEYVDLFSVDSGRFPEVLEGIAGGSMPLPVVIAAGHAISAGAKLRASIVGQALLSLGLLPDLQET